MKKMDINDLVDLVERAADKYQRALERIEKDGKEIFDEANKRVNKQYYEIQKETLHSLFEKAVTKFYEDYEPRRYKNQRRMSLYKAWDDDPPTDERGLIDFDEAKELLDTDAPETVMRDGGGSSYLFNQTFMLGWHGGAFTINDDAAEEWWPHPDYKTPHWRGFGRKTDGTFHMWGKWSSRAERFRYEGYKSPYSLFEHDVDDAYATTLPEYYRQIQETERHYANRDAYEAMVNIMRDELGDIFDF